MTTAVLIAALLWVAYGLLRLWLHVDNLERRLRTAEDVLMRHLKRHAGHGVAPEDQERP